MTRTEAILAAVRAGQRDGEVADRHGVSRAWAGQIRRQAGLPPNTRPPKPTIPSPSRWTDAQVAYLVAHADARVQEVAATIGRTPAAVRAMRSRLIAESRIAPSRVPMADAELALLADPALTDAEIVRQTGRAPWVIAHARRIRGYQSPDSRRVTQPWTDAEIETLIAMANCPAAEAAARLGRTARAVEVRRSLLIREGRLSRRKRSGRAKRG